MDTRKSHSAPKVSSCTIAQLQCSVEVWSAQIEGESKQSTQQTSKWQWCCGTNHNTEKVSSLCSLNSTTSPILACVPDILLNIMFNWHKQLKCNDVGCMHMHSCERCHSCHDSQLQKKPLKTCICVKGCKQHHVNDTIWKTMFFFCSWFDEPFWVLSHMMTLTVLDNFQWTCCNRVVPSRGCWSRDMWSSDFWRTPPCVKFWSTSHRFC